MSQAFERGLLKSELLVGSRQIRIGGKTISAIDFITEAAKAGVTAVVINAVAFASETGPQKVALGLQVKELCRQFNLPLMVVDDFQMAQQIEADGLIIQQDPDTLRDIVAGINNDMFVGYYCDTIDKVDYANRVDQVSYIIVSNGDNTKTLINQSNKPIAISGTVSEEEAKTLKGYGACGLMSTNIFSNADDLAQTVKNVNEIFD